MKYRALLSFNAHGYLKNMGEEFEIEDENVKADLEKIGFVEPVQEVQAKFGRVKKD